MRYYQFNQYLKQKFGERVQKVILDAALGCPNRDGTKGVEGCIYCDRFGSGSGAGKGDPDIQTQALRGMEYSRRRYRAKKFIPYLQSFTNTYAPLDILHNLYDTVIHLPNVVGLAVGTRPDCLSQEVLELLSSYAPRMMVWLELGLQTVHDETLRFINRGHTFQEFIRGYKLARQYPLLICVHVIIGLPGEGPDQVIATAREIAHLKPDGIKIHSLYINKGTRLEELYQQGKYLPLEQEEFVTLACDFLEVLPPQVVIQRLTGDPNPRELIAPGWSLRKQETLTLINAELERRDTWQGKKMERKTGGEESFHSPRKDGQNERSSRSKPSLV